MIDRFALEELARDLISYCVHKLGSRIGIALFVFEYGQSKNLAYVSTAQRADMIAAVKEWLARVEAGLDTDPPGPRATS